MKTHNTWSVHSNKWLTVQIFDLKRYNDKKKNSQDQRNPEEITVETYMMPAII